MPLQWPLRGHNYLPTHAARWQGRLPAWEVRGGGRGGSHASRVSRHGPRLAPPVAALRPSTTSPHMLRGGEGGCPRGRSMAGPRREPRFACLPPWPRHAPPVAALRQPIPRRFAGEGGCLHGRGETCAAAAARQQALIAASRPICKCRFANGNKWETTIHAKLQSGVGTGLTDVKLVEL